MVELSFKVLRPIIFVFHSDWDQQGKVLKHKKDDHY